MFGKDNNTTKNQRPNLEDNKIETNNNKIETNKKKESIVIANTKPSVILAELTINGDITGSSDVNIYGKVEGSIYVVNHQVNIETSAVVKADITAKTIIVDGKVTGNIVVSERALVTSEGSVTGDINSPKLELQNGAVFDGNVSMKKIVNDTISSNTTNNTTRNPHAIQHTSDTISSNTTNNTTSSNTTNNTTSSNTTNNTTSNTPNNKNNAKKPF